MRPLTVLLRGREIEYCIEQQILEKVNMPKEGNLIIYFDKKPKADVHLTHSGIVTNSKKILSKWGTIPAIFEHVIDEVPAGYGKIEDIQYFQLLNRKNFIRFVNTRTREPFWDTYCYDGMSRKTDTNNDTDK